MRAGRRTTPRGVVIVIDVDGRSSATGLENTYCNAPGSPWAMVLISTRYGAALSFSWFLMAAGMLTEVSPASSPGSRRMLANWAALAILMIWSQRFLICFTSSSTANQSPHMSFCLFSGFMYLRQISARSISISDELGCQLRPERFEVEPVLAFRVSTRSSFLPVTGYDLSPLGSPSPPIERQPTSNQPHRPRNPQPAYLP